MRQRLYTTFTVFLIWQMAAAQPVAFFLKSSLLHSVSGFTAYSDCAVDMNGDQLDDVVRIGNKGLYIDYQHHDGSFSQKFFSILIQSPPSWSICAGDLDNNGYNDLLFADSASVSFVTANEIGSGYKENVMASTIFCQRSTLADINNDGWLDGFVCDDDDQSIPFRNDGQGNMSPDTNLIHTADRPGNYAAIWTDYNNDGDIDLYVTKCLGGALPGNINRTNLLYRNNGDGSFSEVGALAGLDDNAQSWSTVFEDFDNDGDFDAFIINHDFQNRLFRNNGDGTFTNVIAASGINANDLGAFENASGDFNNDGFIDIYSDLQNELYLGKGDLTFSGQDVPLKVGAIADLNNDGFLDLYHNSQLWLNKGNSNHWLKVAPLGISGNRNGIGARIEIYGEWGMQVRELRSGQSYTPMSSLNAHFGLGQNGHVDSLKVRWPSGIVTTLENISVDTLLVVPEVSCLLSSSLLSIDGDTSICPGDTTQLLAPDGFLIYLWSNNQTGQSISVAHEGNFFVIGMDSSGCASLSQTIEIELVEDVLPVIFSPKGTVICKGDTLILTASSSEHYTWSDGTTDIQTLNVTEAGIYTVATDAICFQGQRVSAPFEVMVLPSLPPLVSDVVIGQGDSILLTAMGENCQWYEQAKGGNLLATGPMFQTMPLSQSTTYYVESHHIYPGEIQFGGKLDTAGTGGIPTQSGYLLFETWEPFKIHSVTVYLPPGAPLVNRFVQLYKGDALVAFKQFPVQTGLNELDLNFDVSVGQFSLRCPLGKLWRDTGQLNYPYPIGDVGQITSSSFGENYYYYFYNWKIQKPNFECVSERAVANVSVTGIYEPVNAPLLNVFPNPSDGLFFVEIKDASAEATFFRLLDANGSVLLTQLLVSAHFFQLDLNKLPAGFYLLQVFGDVFFQTRAILKY